MNNIGTFLRGGANALKRRFSTSGVAAKGANLVLEPLPNREMLRIQGEEVVPFLQGLITNDMNHLQNSNNPNASMYAMFLNKSGRVLYDTIIYRTIDPATFLIECDKSVSSELQRHLRIFRVRRKINIDSVNEDYKHWSVFNANLKGGVQLDIEQIPDDVYLTLDPRLSDLGLRFITRPDQTFNSLYTVLKRKLDPVEVHAASPYANHRLLRYANGVGEGHIDIPPGKSFPLEANGDYLHGVSFQKGCYIGQELTARVHHTGVVRKRYMPLYFKNNLPTFDDNDGIVQTVAGKNVGKLRGICGKRALALLRIEPALKSEALVVDGELCSTEKPKWWPAELPNKAPILREDFQ